MPLQSDNLAMVGLGVDSAQTALDPFPPKLTNGIQLRWACDPERGIPFHGYYLAVRNSNDPRRICISGSFDPKWAAGPMASATLSLNDGTLDSDTPLACTEAFAGAGAREFDLRDRAYLRFTLSPGRLAHQFQVTVGAFGGRATGAGTKDNAKSDAGGRPVETEVPAPPPRGCLAILFAPFTWLISPRRQVPVKLKVTGFDGGVPVASKFISMRPGQTASVLLAADRMDRVEIEGGAAALIDICYAAVGQDVANGWRPVKGFTYPLCLPSAEPGYPCVGKPATSAAAEALALSRVRYGPASDWAATVGELRGVVDALVANGPPPSGQAMIDRSASFPDSLLDPDAPIMPDLRPLELVLLGAINPAVAQMVGLYWVDDPGDYGLYDYLLLADHSGRFHGDVGWAIAAMAHPLPADVDGWICYGLSKADAPPLPPPAEVQVFALPGTATDPALIAQDKVEAAGLRWRIDQTAQGDLLPGSAIGYHLWRADLGTADPAAPPTAYNRITTNGMIMVCAPPPGGGLPGGKDWPPLPMHRIDPHLGEGWYSYRAAGMDLFGRLSALSASASWRQWAPEPEPRPWYYVGPASDAEVHPYAVHLLSKRPPPPPPAVEAWALDPLDPALAGDPVYDAWHAVGWWNGLPAADRPKRTGLCVRWCWSPEQMAQAPHTREFRIYLSPGSDPVADYRSPAAWPQRVYVIDANTHFTPMLDSNNQPTGSRQYQILLPEDLAGQTFPGVPLEPTDLDPIVYAHVGVSAADDRQHSADDSKWAGSPWGNRYGNEGKAGLAKIFRVLRAPPPAPPLIGKDDKVWATRADYHGISRYTVRWVDPAAGQKVHIFRCVDDTLFRADWERRHAGGAAFQLSDLQPFGWSTAKNADVLTRLGAPLDAVAALDWDDDPQVRVAYELLTEPALRVLASFPGNDGAFVQMTFEPLDPTLPANDDRAGPDATAPYPPNPAWGSWIAEIDGRAVNRYFFRTAYVNSAHIMGPLGPSSPAVYLPKVAAPGIPAITKVTCGELSITLAWAHNREPDFAEYRIYRADDARQARDARLMARVLTLAAIDVDTSLPAVEWTDAVGLIGGRTYLYSLTSVDAAGNESEPSAGVQAVAVDSRVPDAPVWTAVNWMLQNTTDATLAPWPSNGVVPSGFRAVLELQWIAAADQAPTFLAAARTPEQAFWGPVGEGAALSATSPSPGQYHWIVPDAVPDQARYYRAVTRAATGMQSRPSSELFVDAAPLP